MRHYIFHIDVNSAFLSWSALQKLKEDPDSVDLRTIPSAVGGDVETRHGIITAKSIPAKKYGVQTAEPVGKALQKCPQLVLVKGDFQLYRACSRAFIDVLHEYTDQVEKVSIDEAYLDPTGLEHLLDAENPYPHPYPYPLNLAYHIKDTVYARLGFTVNVGVSTNRLLAKMASDFTKPNRVHTLFPEEIPQKMWPLPLGELHGCGRATAEKLARVGIRTIGDAAHTDLKILQSLLGEKGGSHLHRSANGISRAVVQTERDEAKSYSNETTTPFDITDDNYEKAALPIVQHLSEKVASRMQRDGIYAGTIDVSVKTDSFQRRSRQRRLKSSTNDQEEIFREAVQLMEELLRGPKGLFAAGHHVRLIGVGGSNLDHGEFRQIGLFEALEQMQTPEDPAQEEKKARLAKMQAQIEKRFGKEILKKGLK
ncbi:MAG: DNA polymerase IV [Eubacterium sp.]|nr:DNA polymerase IV [Eubacterium sp.]